MSAGWNELEGVFRVHSSAQSAYANSEGLTITYTGQLSDIHTGAGDTFALGAVGLSVRLVFVERQAATAYISEQVGTDDHDGIIAYDTNGKIGIRQLDDLPTNLRNVASDLTDVEQGGLRTKLGFHHFDIPRNYVLLILSLIHISEPTRPY